MTTHESQPVDGFSLTYDDEGTGPGVMLLHGWPGDRGDYRELVPLLADRARLIVPDLRGFGSSDKADPDVDRYGPAGQARSVLGLLDELGLADIVLVGYDVGSGVAHEIARTRPDVVRAMVLAPPMPGIGPRSLTPDNQREYWYQCLHHQDLADQLVDGRPEQVRAYLRHFWSHWSGPDFVVTEQHLDRLLESYGAPGAFTASISWYRTGADAYDLNEPTPTPGPPSQLPVTVFWPEFDPLFPRDWADAISLYYAKADLRLIDGVGYFAPLEYPAALAAAVLERLAAS